MRVARSIQELIGETPLLQLTRFDLLLGVELYAKLEYLNPGGSVKDRLGLALIRSAEAEGHLQPGGTIIEPTAGNTGIGLALAAIGTNYQVIFCVPAKFSQEKQELMRALGAQVVNTPTVLGGCPPGLRLRLRSSRPDHDPDALLRRGSPTHRR
jgi:O-acetylserine dependent cystathionine beta-synthase